MQCGCNNYKLNQSIKPPKLAFSGHARRCWKCRSKRTHCTRRIVHGLVNVRRDKIRRVHGRQERSLVERRWIPQIEMLLCTFLRWFNKTSHKVQINKLRNKNKFQRQKHSNIELSLTSEVENDSLFDLIVWPGTVSENWKWLKLK